MLIGANLLRSGLFMNDVELLFLYIFFSIAGSFKVSLVIDLVCPQNLEKNVLALL